MDSDVSTATGRRLSPAASCRSSRPRRRGSAALFAAALLTAVTATTEADAGEVRVAVAANFTAAANDIAALFRKASGDTVVFSFGSTGQLYTQIAEGAPFEVFLSADRARPERAVKEGYAVPDSRFTYATGKIVLFSMDKHAVTGEATLEQAKFTRIAICNPVTAPYGRASVEAMKALGVYDKLRRRLVEGENITQAYQFVFTGNAEVGLVALSQVARDPDKGSRWVVPANLYRPIAQDAVLLQRGAANPAARAFIAFLEGKEARAVIEKYGYGSGE